MNTLYFDILPPELNECIIMYLGYMGLSNLLEVIKFSNINWYNLIEINYKNFIRENIKDYNLMEIYIGIVSMSYNSLLDGQILRNIVSSLKHNKSIHSYLIHNKIIRINMNYIIELDDVDLYESANPKTPKDLDRAILFGSINITKFILNSEPYKSKIIYLGTHISNKKIINIKFLNYLLKINKQNYVQVLLYAYFSPMNLEGFKYFVDLDIKLNKMDIYDIFLYNVSSATINFKKFKLLFDKYQDSIKDDLLKLYHRYIPKTDAYIGSCMDEIYKVNVFLANIPAVRDAILK